jgi:hypothetical protein
MSAPVLPRHTQPALADRLRVIPTASGWHAEATKGLKLFTKKVLPQLGEL